MKHWIGGIVVLLGLVASASAAAETLNGFELSNASIPVEEILPGGPPRDGIPAIDAPAFTNAIEARFLSAEDRVIGVARHGVAKAYPIAILNWHEIVNDKIGPDAIVVTFCPLCGTGMVFAGRDGLSFGVSGLLYNSDVLMYDHETESLWSQLKMEAVTGQRRGQKMELLPASHTTWADWRKRHPATLVMSLPANSGRDYGRDPYAEYRQSSRLFFPVSSDDARYHPKEQVIGVTIGDESWAWPLAELSQSVSPVKDKIDGRAVEVRFDSTARTGGVFTHKGEEIPSTIAYWFAWISFYPNSVVYKAPR